MTLFDFSVGLAAGMILIMFIAYLLPKPKPKKEGEIYMFNCISCGTEGKAVIKPKLDGDVLYCVNCANEIKLVPEAEGRRNMMLRNIKKKKGGKIL